MGTEVTCLTYTYTELRAIIGGRTAFLWTDAFPDKLSSWVPGM